MFFHRSKDSLRIFHLNFCRLPQPICDQALFPQRDLVRIAKFCAEQSKRLTNALPEPPTRTRQARSCLHASHTQVQTYLYSIEDFRTFSTPRGEGVLPKTLNRKN